MEEVIDIADVGYPYQLGMIYDEELRSKLTTDGFVESNEVERDSKKFIKNGDFAITFLPSIEGNLVLSMINNSSKKYSIFNIKIAEEALTIDENKDRTISDKIYKVFEEYGYFPPDPEFRLNYISSMNGYKNGNDKSIILRYQPNYQINEIIYIFLPTFMPFFCETDIEKFKNQDTYEYQLGMVLDKKLYDKLHDDGFKVTSLKEYDERGECISGNLSWLYTSDLLSLTFSYKLRSDFLTGINILPENRVHTFLGIKIGDNYLTALEKLAEYGYVKKEERKEENTINLVRNRDKNVKLKIQDDKVISISVFLSF